MRKVFEEYYMKYCMGDYDYTGPEIRGHESKQPGVLDARTRKVEFKYGYIGPFSDDLEILKYR